MSIRLLLASDYPMVRDGLRLLLRPAREIRLIAQAENLAEAPEKFRHVQPDVALLDVAASASAGGLRVVHDILKASPDARTVVVTNNDSVSFARTMLKTGARGLVLKHSPSPALITAVRVTAAGEKFVDPRVSAALEEHGEHKLPWKNVALTQRESDILGNLARGYTNAQTASHLKLTLRTVESYRARIYRKLHLNSRADIVNYAIAHSLLA
jgi:two-component system, NarL family, response regulator NreC